MKVNILSSKVGRALFCAALLVGAPQILLPTSAYADTKEVEQSGVVKGVVLDENGEPCIGAVVFVVGTKTSATTDDNGAFELQGVQQGATVRCSLIGYERQDLKWEGGALNFSLKENGKLQEVVVTAMGIVRKEKSLTYATQQIKADDLMKVEDVNLVNSLDGKVSGLTITPSAGGAGGASKILLRGSQSVMGNNAPLIVVDGVPMTNNTRNQAGGEAKTFLDGAVSEGSDALSMINPDDIEAINVLKGANAAALYGSAAANGVIMITTKKGKAGRLDVSFTSNVTFDTPLLTPSIQNEYGGYVNGQSGMSGTSWGSRMGTQPFVEGLGYGFYAIVDSKYQQYDQNGAAIDRRFVHLRNAAKDDVKDFYRLGVTTNNSISLSGGTEKVKTYFSYANSHANGMVETNTYNRNSFAFRQNYRLFDRVTVEASINYIQTKTRNRLGGGMIQNPVYDLYTMPRDIDLDYYRTNYKVDNGTWFSESQSYYKSVNNLVTEQVQLNGPMQNWFSQAARQNNPYWLLNMNQGQNKEDRVFGYVNGVVDIYDGLTFQARVSIDHTRYTDTGRRYATTQGPSAMYDFGTYSRSNSRSDELYTDYLLSYNKSFGDWSVSATAGWVAHLLKNEGVNTYIGAATNFSGGNDRPHTQVNMFEVGYGGVGVTSQSKGTNWDKAALVTAQLGWKERLYIDGSYRRDWYRAFRQFSKNGTPDNYGYFSVGGNAILSELFYLPEQVSYLKYRLSYSEVGNSIPNVPYNSITYNVATGTYTSTGYGTFANPIPETTRSFETGIESQFFNNRLSFDLTFYNTALCNSYLVVSLGGKSTPVNTGKIRNRGFEASISYNFRFGRDWTWRTTLNGSYNKNSILETYINPETNKEALIASDVAWGRVRVKYNIGGQYGDMYITDYMRDEQGQVEYTADGKPRLETATEQQFAKYVGNMNANWQLGWSNTISYKNFSLYFLINGRIGGKVISFTEAELDKLGVSQRTADARLYAEQQVAAGNTDYLQNGKLMMEAPGRTDGLLIPIETYYSEIGGQKHAQNYIYNATNVRLRELSFGYTFRDLLGENKNLTLSFVGRNLFFFYKDAPVDPDVAVSTANSLSAFECFSMPSARSYGVSLKLNF